MPWRRKNGSWDVLGGHESSAATSDLLSEPSSDSVWLQGWGGVHQLLCLVVAVGHDSWASSTLTSGDASTLDSGPLSETSASGSDDPPCRSFHPMTFPRDGHPPLEEAISSGEFPVKPVVTERGGVDEMGPWR